MELLLYGLQLAELFTFWYFLQVDFSDSEYIYQRSQSDNICTAQGST